MFFEVDVIPPMAAMSDSLAHVNSVAAHPNQLRLLRLGLYPGRDRFQRNFDALYAFNQGAPLSLTRAQLRVGSRCMNGTTFTWTRRRVNPACCPADLTRRVYDRPMSKEDTKVWAALRRAFPSAMEDQTEFEKAVANITIIYVASYESTANAAMHTMAALALDQNSQEALCQVWPRHSHAASLPYLLFHACGNTG